MSTAAFGRPAAQPGPEAENPNPRSNGGIPNSAPLNQGVHVTGQDPGVVHPQHLMSARPVFYIQAPPPPPYLHYQWPVPFYNPFNPFSGMGYGMMMPPFPPAPYMEPPAYFLPHAPVQPVDYRRVVHTQPHPNSAPYQNLNQSRRPRQPHTGQVVRETVNSEVQTEPTHSGFNGGSPIRSCSDSGRETALNSPTSSTSSYQKKSNGDGENCSRTREGLQLRIACTRSGIKPGLRMPHPGERESIQKIGKESFPVNSPSLVRPETVATVDLSDKEMSKKERRVSVPDILMSWGNGTQQEDKMVDDKSHKLPLYEDEVEHFQISTVVNEDQLEAAMADVEKAGSDSEKEENDLIMDSKLHYEPYEHSLNISIKVCNAGHDTANEATLEEPSENPQTASGKFRQKLNESVWSVESLPIFIPTKEWLVQNSTSGPEVIVEMAEEAENGGPNDEPVKDGHQSVNSSTDSVPMSDSFLGFSTPASKMTGKQARSVTSEPKIYKMQKRMNPLDSPVCKQSKLALTTKEVKRNESSEPNSPTRKSFTIEEELEKSPASNKGQTSLVESEKATGQAAVQKKTDLGSETEQLPVPQPVHAVLEVSPSKGHLVDCGVQFPELQTGRGNGGMNRKQQQQFKSSDVHNTSTRSEGFYMNGNGKKRHNQWRNKGQDRANGQQEAFYAHFDKPGKPRGGKGRY